MYCPHCHTENRESAKFCNECGFPLTGLIAESEAANASAPAAAKRDEEPAEKAVDAEDVVEGSPADAAEAKQAHPEVVLPTIDVRGLNVDEEGNPFSFDDETREAPADVSLAEDGEVGPTSGLDVQADDDFDFEPLTDEEYETDAESDGERIDPTFDAASDTRVSSDVSSADETQSLQPVAAKGQGLWQAGATMEMPAVAEQQGFGGYRAPEEPAKKRGKGRLMAIVVIVLALIAAAAAFATYSMELWGGKAVPNVEGMTEADARTMLEGDGFTVQTMQVVSDGTQGLVLLSEPSAGSRLEEGSEVIIHVAAARTIPEVVGLAQEDALKLLDDKGYVKVSVQRQKSNEPEGTVLAVSPEEGQRVSSSTQVTVTVAEPYTVPDVLHLPAADAQAALEAEGYVVNVSRVYTESATEGTVIATDPVSGSQLNSGETVTIQVAMSRATECTNAAYGILWAGANVSVGGVNYTITSVDSVTYQGNDTVAYSFTGTPYTYFLGVRIELDPTTVSGTITFNDDNTVQSSSPTLASA